MAELSDTERYAAAGLFALALVEAERHQRGQYYRQSTEDTQVYSLDGEETSKSKDTFWSSKETGLCEHVFRLLQLSDQMSESVERLVSGSLDASVHLEMFLKILETEQHNVQSEKAQAAQKLSAALQETENQLAEARRIAESAPPAELAESPRTDLRHILGSGGSGSFSFTKNKSGLKAGDRQDSAESASPGSRSDSGSSGSSRGDEGSGQKKSGWKWAKGTSNRWSHGSAEDAATIAKDGQQEQHEPTVTAQEHETLASDFQASATVTDSGGFSDASPGLTGSKDTAAIDPELTSEQQKAQEDAEKKTNEAEEERTKTAEEIRAFYSFTSANSSAISEPLRCTLLYELVSACVADLPEEKAGRSKLRSGYDARQRVALRYVASWLDLPWHKVTAMEYMVAFTAFELQKQREAANEEEAAKKTQSNWSGWRKGAIIGGTALAAGALMAVTAGLAAPAVIAGLAAVSPTLAAVPILGTTLAAVITLASSSTAVVAAFGAAGAGLGGVKMSRRIGDVQEFEFVELKNIHQQGRLGVGVFVSGYVHSKADYTEPWGASPTDLQSYALIYESQHLIPLTSNLEAMLRNAVVQKAMTVGAAYTVLATFVAAIAWPLALVSATNMIDSRYALAVNRSDKAGKLLGDLLHKRQQGERPVTLIGYSMGTRVIYSCLKRLATKKDYEGIIERVVLLGTALPARDEEGWSTVRKVVAGRFVNGYCTNDWTLGLMYRSSFLLSGVAGIQPVEMAGIENVDLTPLLKDGHSSYGPNLKTVLQKLDINCPFPTLERAAKSDLIETTQEEKERIVRELERAAAAEKQAETGVEDVVLGGPPQSLLPSSPSSSSSSPSSS
eukprot:TRINITY_DN8178_c0_g1_i2.p1 TRINITY_DN8178_c0_g1~~TRINITY_DN8178_c0_g1_i2.p1  ORF type:complete len:845 (-),score=150.14 TRINITY_DN8178_c0_g1_i2:256-2790(-)